MPLSHITVTGVRPGDQLGDLEIATLESMLIIIPALLFHRIINGGLEISTDF